MQSVLSLNDEPFPELKSWLNHPSSLIERFSKEQGEAAKLTLIKQVWEQSDWWDFHNLGIDEPKVLRREVLIYGKGQPCWYGRTILPQSCFDLNPEFFQKINQAPLSTLLFHEEMISRIVFEHYPISKHHIEWYWMPQSLRDEAIEVLWVRLSTFKFLNKGKFGLCEIFTPEFLKSLS